MNEHLIILQETRDELAVMGVHSEIRARRVICKDCRFRENGHPTPSAWRCAVHGHQAILKEGHILNPDGLCERWEPSVPPPVPPRRWMSPLIWTPAGAVLGFLLGLVVMLWL